jgi:hypothetical protein
MRACHCGCGIPSFLNPREGHGPPFSDCRESDCRCFIIFVWKRVSSMDHVEPTNEIASWPHPSCGVVESWTRCLPRRGTLALVLVAPQWPHDGAATGSEHADGRAKKLPRQTKLRWSGGGPDSGRRRGRRLQALAPSVPGRRRRRARGAPPSCRGQQQQRPSAAVSAPRRTARAARTDAPWPGSGGGLHAAGLCGGWCSLAVRPKQAMWRAWFRGRSFGKAPQARGSGSVGLPPPRARHSNTQRATRPQTCR